MDSLNSQTKCNTLVKVLSWERVMDMSPLKRGVRLPDYKPRDTRSAKSRQVWDRSAIYSG